jgi:predicted phage terminase large subunit-like protein
MKLTKEEFRAMVRQDFYAFTQGAFQELNPTVPFLHNWHLEAISSALDECRLRKTKRLIVNEPPRSLKSHTASSAFPAFILGHDPTAQIICASYGQDLANKLALDCRRLMLSPWYHSIFPDARLSSERQAIQELTTTRGGSRLSTSVGGVLTGRGADYIIIDDPLKPEEALSESQRKAVNSWYDHTLYSRLNNKNTGCIILIMQRLHEDDLVGHVLGTENWKIVRFPAIAEADEIHGMQTPYGYKRYERKAGEALHPERESLELLKRIREVQGEFNFSGQYQQAPAPLGGGMVKAEWFRPYSEKDLPSKFEMVLQSWDTANKPTELSDYSACTTWGIREKHLYLLNVHRKRLGYPDLKRAVRDQAEAFGPQTILVEDKASGTQLIQELVSEGMHAIQRYEPTMDKIMRMYSVTSTIENGFAHLPERAAWLGEFLHELTTFPKGKYDDQADSTSQALDWFKCKSMSPCYGLLDFVKNHSERMRFEGSSSAIPASRTCSRCGGEMNQRIPNGLRCMNCGAQWSPAMPSPGQITRTEILNRSFFAKRLRWS